MSFTAEQLAYLDSRRFPVPMGFYYTRGERAVIPEAIANNPSLAAGELGYTVDADPIDDTPYPVLSGGSRQFPHWGDGGDGWSLDAYLNSALGYRVSPTKPTTPDGAIRSHSTAGSLPRLEHEICAILNVKTWHIEGEVNGFMFSETVAAGTISSFTPGLDTGDPWLTPHTARSAYSTEVKFDDIDGDDSFSVSVSIARHLFSGAGPADVSDEMNETPSFLHLLPVLGISIIDLTSKEGDAYSGSLRTPASFGPYLPAVEDSDIVFCGRPVWRVIDSESEAPPRVYSLSIAPASFWTPEDAWFTF